MPEKTAAEWFTTFRAGGLFISRGEKYYFVPADVLQIWELPKAFQADADGFSSEFFKKVHDRQGNTDECSSENVYHGIRRALSKFRLAEGYEAAAWIEATTDEFSRAQDSKAVLFEYDNAKSPTKIVVDMSKGGKPSQVE